MKKLKFFIFFLICLFNLFLFFYLVPKDYIIKYTINDFTIIENYNKKGKYYSFYIKNKDNNYVYSIQNKYLRKRKLIKKINLNGEVLNIKIDKLGKFTITLKDGIYYTNYYDNTFDSKIIDDYQNIKVYNKMSNIYIWNYNSFINISNKGFNKITLLEKDEYEPTHITKYEDNILLPDYKNKYIFENILLLNSKNNKVKNIKLNKKIYYNSYFMGEYKKYLYLFDIQEGKEYQINPLNGYVEKMPFERIKNGNWEKISLNKLNKKEGIFLNESLFYYKLDKNTLKYITPDNVIMVTNLSVDRIVQSDNYGCFFISDDSLYYADNNAITKLLQYNEWKFNNNNIFIFD